ncbi:hypothetical protein BATDEDRAFT_85260 [Batrachochytrium dendrobatidis JAM81]|uniref:Uncharacterized protein n=1 Tax=Batrachochytrium dendrobatidis (strain JAM81 / FGSC 10211) TaxID=684364 RepID=F4NUG1_BATDJ|nr:uncharacterized protein BATDEDRAFT_85260 [Batrachochytrium dendrobatidis JAM81]EGF84405.1 hypothetical protein BATDEDRAFT_85260 [Batrachochytrium dendrobatidis JAM81]KAJ8327317.1 hypothetical protein O5D80_004716 [Batrachochytrium dendrobatidis]|eukprot:XP_006676427.1 hypothetical protein BATDEDRAFT_85260 [Batrachochytrium dendrobatidis JAM81]
MYAPNAAPTNAKKYFKPAIFTRLRKWFQRLFSPCGSSPEPEPESERAVVPVTKAAAPKTINVDKLESHLSPQSTLVSLAPKCIERPKNDAVVNCHDAKTREDALILDNGHSIPPFVFTWEEQYFSVTSHIQLDGAYPHPIVCEVSYSKGETIVLTPYKNDQQCVWYIIDSFMLHQIQADILKNPPQVPEGLGLESYEFVLQIFFKENDRKAPINTLNIWLNDVRTALNIYGIITNSYFSQYWLDNLSTYSF